jgi:hypothetical protein
MINGLPYYSQHRDYSDKLLGEKGTKARKPCFLFGHYADPFVQTLTLTGVDPRFS